MHNIKITLSYDGTNYYGWQKTISGPSIEEAIKKALETILQKKIKIQAASRTDKNVHANNQVANFFLENDFDLDRLKYKMNMMLPKDIRIMKLEKTDYDFHPTLSAKKKEYKYYIYQNEFASPIFRFYSWHVYQKIDLEKINKAKTLLIGKKDFSAFTSRKQKNNIRTIFDIKIEKKEDQIIISIIGDKFLYKMVRIIIGTLVYIGIDKIKFKDLEKIVLSKSREHLGITAPAKGLFLHKITY